MEWVDGSDRRVLYRTIHNDEAVNIIFELSSKDIMLRATAIVCPLDSQNQPDVEANTEINPDSIKDKRDPEGPALSPDEG